MHMSLSKEKKRKIAAFSFLICITFALIGFSLINYSKKINLSQDMDQQKSCGCGHSIPIIPSSSFQVEDELVSFYSDPNNTTNIYQLQFSLLYNESSVSDLRAYVAFNESRTLTPPKFYIDMKLNNRDQKIHFDQISFFRIVYLSDSWHQSSSLVWIEWADKINNDVYLDPLERVTIHIWLGDNNLIKWGDSITFRLLSTLENVDQSVDLSIILPSMMPLESNQVKGEYSRVATLMY